MSKIRWADTLSTWPSLTIRVQLMPWHWRFSWYSDESEPYIYLTLGPVEFHFGANRDFWFALERDEAPHA